MGNQFYKSSDQQWLLLVLDASKLKAKVLLRAMGRVLLCALPPHAAASTSATHTAHAPQVVFEPAAPVGDTPSFKADPAAARAAAPPVLFPHL